MVVLAETKDQHWYQAELMKRFEEQYNTANTMGLFSRRDWGAVRHAASRACRFS